MQYWPWWIGALALGGITFGFRVLLGRPFGVSSSWARIVHWSEIRKQERSAEALKENSQATSSALMAETLAQFGEHIMDDAPNLSNAQTPAQQTVPTAKAPVIADMAFLVGMFAGSLVIALSSGDWHIQFQLSELHSKISGHSQLQSWIILFFGGLFVGLGTQMAGGCSSGHGLSGCAQLSISSWKATVTFFGTAVLFCLFIKMTLGL